MTRLETITVTAERPRAAAPPVTTLVVPAAELRRTFANNPYDLLRRTSGIEVHEQGQGPGFASDAVIRGFSSDHSSDVLLVLDGVPINLPVHGHVEGYSDWSILSPAAVSSLRVITGPASPLYGDFAMAGVVEVFTAADAVGTTGSLSASSYGDAGGWLRSGRRGDTGGYLLAGDGQRQQGWRDNSSYWLGNGLSAAGGKRAPAGSRAAWRSTARAGTHRDFSRWISTTPSDLTSAMDPTDGGSAYRGIAHGRFSTVAGTTGIEATAWLQHVHSDVFLTIPEDGRSNQSDELDRRNAVGGSLSGEPPAGRRRRERRAGRASRLRQVRFVRHLPADRAESREGLRRGISGRRRLRPLADAGGLSCGPGPGARADGVHYRSLDRVAGSRGRSDGDVVVSPKLGVRYLVAGGWSLLGSLSAGFRGAPGVIGDPSLEPGSRLEQGAGGPVRWRGLSPPSSALFRLDVSHERIQDPVTREVLPTGESLRQGVNLDAEVRLSRVCTSSTGR